MLECIVGRSFGSKLRSEVWSSDDMEDKAIVSSMMIICAMCKEQ